MPALKSSNSQLLTPKSMKNNNSNLFKSHQTEAQIAEKTNREAKNLIPDKSIDNTS